MTGTMTARRYACISVLLAAVLLAGCVVSRDFAQGPALDPAPLPAYRPGDTFQFDNGRTETVESVDAAKGEVTWRNGDVVSRRLASFVVPRLEWRSAAGGGRFVSTDASNALWPLGPESRQRFSGELLRDDGEVGLGHRERLDVECWVAATQTVTVPAGTFDTFRVTCLRRSTGSVRRSRKYTWFYAPEVGHYVARVIAGGFGDINQRIELVRWIRLDPPGTG